jgi:hypothetical protein
MKNYHVCVSVNGLEKRLNSSSALVKWGYWKVLVDENGRFLTYQEVREVIAEARAKGYEVIPNCTKHNKLGYCTGHPVKK